MAHPPRDDETRVRGPAADETVLRGQGPRVNETTVRALEPRPNKTAVRGRQARSDETPVRGWDPQPDETPARDWEPRPDETALRGWNAHADQPAALDDASAIDATDATTLRPPIEATPRPPIDATAARIGTHSFIPAGFADPGAPALAPRQEVPFGPGYRLRDRYELDEMIGQGAMGQVWRAKDLLGEEALDRNPYVAVKVLNSDFEARADAFIALHREATRAQKLAHPNIVTVYVFDRDEHSGRAFIAMELLEGEPLDKVMRKSGATGLPREAAMPIIRGMAEGLAYAHRKGIVHSDFKPANVFVTHDGTPKILDFGIARAVQVAQQVAGIPVPDSLHGQRDDSGFQGYTVNYAAPEALAGAPPSTSEDVFALGIVAYELVSGSHPFKRMSALEAQSANIERPALRGLKRREANAIEKALNYDPLRRFADASAFLRQLQGIPVVQQALAAAVGVLIITAGVFGYRSYLDSQPREPLASLPLQVQQKFHEKISAGNNDLDYLKRTHDVTASQDAATDFAEAYQLHEKDPEAVRGLETAADYAIDWYGKLPDRQQALAQLRLFRARSDFYQTYKPLQKAIRAAGGE
jgi:serine/threonine protein kinase